MHCHVHPERNAASEGFTAFVLAINQRFGDASIILTSSQYIALREKQHLIDVTSDN
jgi:hypothetical protein